MDYLQHQSPATSSSSQTITTIASINRTADAVDLSTSSSTIMLDQEMQNADRMNISSNSSSRSNGSSNNCNRNKVRSSSRCRNICKDFDHQTQLKSTQNQVHNTIDDIRECKNVNISNIKELNKALMFSSHVSSSSTLPRRSSNNNTVVSHIRASSSTFDDSDRCEMGIR
jgi:hypothetical protein